MQSAATVIREARERAGLSQAELARRSGVSQPVISTYENGRRDPSLTMLTKLVAATGHQLRVELDDRPGGTRGLPDTPVGRLLRRRRRAVIGLASKRGMTNLRLFGSVARGTDHDGSDIDLLVDTEPDVGVIAIVGLARELSELLGREVDVVPSAGLKEHVAADVLAEAIPL